MFASSVSAFDPDDLQKLLETNECPECNLSGANLSGVKLFEARPSGAFISGTVLCNKIMPDSSVIFSH